MTELVALRPAAAPLTVSQVNQQARLLLERTFASVSVVGEVGNLKTVSGHVYFSLKDADSQLQAVLFKREASLLRFQLKNGLEVVGRGRLTVYAPYGRYQIVLDRVDPLGAGALQAAFEELKARLGGEGLFASERKRPLPLVPRRVAVVTSPTGAVIRDIVDVATRRFPEAQILVVPTRVQGAEAAESIAQAIARATALAPRMSVDVIIVARGGGSLEDLWGFNDERVARAIAAAPVPVVSAVGHETDFTIADFVADRRAPTPSAAAELVFPVRSELVARLRRPVERAHRLLRRDLHHARHRVTAGRRALGDGRALLQRRAELLVGVQERLARVTRELFDARRERLRELDRRIERLHPRARLATLAMAAGAAQDRILLAMRQRLHAERRELASLGQRLNALSPLAVLERGYGIVLNAGGEALRDAGAARKGQHIDVRLARGALRATVDEVLPGEPEPENR